MRMEHTLSCGVHWSPSEFTWKTLSRTWQIHLFLTELSHTYCIYTHLIASDDNIYKMWHSPDTIFIKLMTILVKCDTPGDVVQTRSGSITFFSVPLCSHLAGVTEDLNESSLSGILPSSLSSGPADAGLVLVSLAMLTVAAVMWFRGAYRWCIFYTIYSVLHHHF